jgi:phosphoglycerate dehydrogenase-like enzyme
VASARVRYNRELFERAVLVKVVSRTGIGLDNVDIDDATACGVAVCHTPDAPTISTAEHALTLLLAVAKDVKYQAAELRQGAKKDYFNASRAWELSGMCLGLVGLGRIGSHVAKVARALGMRVIAVDPAITAEQAAAQGVELLPSLEALLPLADAVSLHVPLSKVTRGLISAQRLALMKPGSILINTARGGLVDERALTDALDRGHLKGAGIDVFEVEPPPPDHPLLHRENVIATPHVAGVTVASRARVWQGAVSQALMVLRGERPPHLVNPAVWPLR